MSKYTMQQCLEEMYILWEAVSKVDDAEVDLKTKICRKLLGERQYNCPCCHYVMKLTGKINCTYCPAIQLWNGDCISKDSLYREWKNFCNTNETKKQIAKVIANWAKEAAGL